MHGSAFVPTTDPRSIPMDPKKMLQRMVLYGTDLSVMIGSNERMTNKNLEKILPKFLSGEEAGFQRIPRELFEEAILKMFPQSPAEVSFKFFSFRL